MLQLLCLPMDYVWIEDPWTSSSHIRYSFFTDKLLYFYPSLGRTIEDAKLVKVCMLYRHRLPFVDLHWLERIAAPAGQSPACRMSLLTAYC